METTLLVLVAFALGGVIGYAMGGKKPDPSPGSDPVAIAKVLCGVIQSQSSELREAVRQSLDVACLQQEDQIRRIDAERLAEMGGSPPSPGPQFLDGNNPGADPGVDEYEIPTEL